MALINQERKWIYLLEPHTASRSTSQALQKNGFIGVGGWHAKLQPLYESGMIPDPLGYEIGVTVRNPLDVLITRWLKSRTKGCSLYDWLTSVEPIYYTRAMLGLWEDATTFCWFEHLEEDLQFIFNEPALKLEFDPTHKSRETPKFAKRSWSYYFDKDPRILDIVLPHYQEFMDKFGYQLFFEVNNPRIQVSEDTRKSLRRRIGS